ncbi:MAG: hypothetical protein FWG83_01180 [Oscillospiraceae bacterium]|nr:hypothetical protein [Oscillospiraceae bacterium]
MKKLIISSALIAALLLTLLTACSKTKIPDENTESASTNSEDLPIESTPVFINGIEVKGVVTSGHSFKVELSVLEALLGEISTFAGYSPEELSLSYEESTFKNAGWSKEDYEEFVARSKEWKPGFAVIGEFIEDAEMELLYEYDDFYKDQVVIGGIANNKLRILEVLIGDITVGEVVEMQQNYAFEEGRDVLLNFGEMTPMNKGDRWIYFLTYNTQSGKYESAGDYNGRYPIPNEKIEGVTDEYIYQLKTFSDWMKDKKTDMTYLEAIEKGVIGRTDENGGYYQDGSTVFGFDSNDVFYLSKVDLEEEQKIWTEFNERKIADGIDTSFLGVYNREKFNFALYSVILDHFKIEAQDWTNPGRDFDAKLIELAKQQ